MPSGIRKDLRSLAGKSIVYGAGSVLLRGLTFLLLPVYTRYLAPADYGVVTVTATLIAILGVFFPLGLHGALGRFYYSTDSPEERRARGGTIWLATLLVAAAMAVVLDRAGAPLLGQLLPQVPFDPYLRIAIWTAFFAVFGLVPLVLLQVQERPGPYIAASLGAALATTGFILVLVVGFRQGALGYLLGGLAGAVVAAVWYTGIAVRNVRVTIRAAVLWPALAYSLPLVPHALAGWVLELSDRAILSRFVPLAQVGIYSLGYQVGTALGLVVVAFNNAWVPYLFKTLAANGQDQDRRLARLAGYFVMVLCFSALGFALMVEPMLRLVVAPAYLPAAAIAPWVIGANVLYGLYVIPIGLLFWKDETRRIPLVTLAAAAVNVGLNLWLVPRYGIAAAAWSTLAAYAVMCAAAWSFAHRIRPFPHEYGRLARTLAAAVALYALGSLLPSWGVLGVSARVAVWLAFPLCLAALGVFESREIAAVRALRWERAS